MGLELSTAIESLVYEMFSSCVRISWRKKIYLGLLAFAHHVAFFMASWTSSTFAVAAPPTREQSNAIG